MLSWSNNENKPKMFSHCINLSLIIFVWHLSLPLLKSMKRKKSKLQSYQFCLTTNKDILDWVLDWHRLTPAVVETVPDLTFRCSPRHHFWVWTPPTWESCTLLLEGKMLGAGRSAATIWTNVPVALAGWWHRKAAIQHCCICSWRGPWWSSSPLSGGSQNCQMKDASSGGWCEVSLSESNIASQCRWTHASMLKHRLDLTVRFPTAQGNCWCGVGFGVPVGAHSQHGQVAMMGCYGVPLGAEKTIPLSLALGPQACNFLRSSTISFHVLLSGRGNRLGNKTWCFFHISMDLPSQTQWQLCC